MTDTSAGLTSGGPCAVPLDELLQRVPPDARYTYTEPDGVKATHFIPIGRYAHEAVALLADLRGKLAESQAEARGLREVLSRRGKSHYPVFQQLEAERARVREMAKYVRHHSTCESFRGYLLPRALACEVAVCTCGASAALPASVDAKGDAK
jgi:hypothetical protein